MVRPAFVRVPPGQARLAPRGVDERGDRVRDEALEEEDEAAVLLADVPQALGVQHVQQVIALATLPLGHTPLPYAPDVLPDGLAVLLERPHRGGVGGGGPPE